ncbi:predicted protein [Naegleria gruberi]|uniref:Predicted protein n=1 Tax=Naegleria gruberi TaxID=5762 RepID=D2VWY3_NAEGR|nr:uncharacterized protein NAEGRDRAFT_81525 [Naegleria gruberi]EFC38709.1 predicted protein [Naegleria gruberi]|eukprot:XP_002671453.1 predicted protein [Naegleria gruberi strain NEG-M]
MGNKFAKGARFRRPNQQDETSQRNDEATSPSQYRIVSTEEIQANSSPSNHHHHPNNNNSNFSSSDSPTLRKSKSNRTRSLSTSTTTGGNNGSSSSGSNNARSSPGTSPTSHHQRFLLTNNHTTTTTPSLASSSSTTTKNSPPNSTVISNQKKKSGVGGSFRFRSLRGNNSASASSSSSSSSKKSKKSNEGKHNEKQQPQLQLNDSNLNSSVQNNQHHHHNRTISNGSTHSGASGHFPLLSSSSTGMIQTGGHFHRKTSSQPPPNWATFNYQNSGSLLSPNGTGNPLVSLQMSPSPSSWQNNYFIYNYAILSSSAPQPSTVNRSLSSSPMSVSSAASSVSNSRDQLVEYQLMEFSPQQRLVHEKLRAMFPSMKNVPDYFLAYFSLVLSDEITLKETIFSNVSDISFYLEMQSKIEELFLEEEERLGKSPSTSRMDHFTPKSPAYHSVTNDNLLANTTEDGDINYSSNFFNSNDAYENITSNLNLNDSYSSNNTSTEKGDIPSSIINFQLDFLNPFHMMSRSELTVRLIILPKIFKNVFYAKTEVAQLMSPVFSTRNNLHFRDSFIHNDEFVVCIMIGFWVLEYIPSSGIIVPKLIYGPSELFSYIQSIPVIATLNNSDGHVMSALISTIVKWNCEKKNPNTNSMTFIDDLLKTLHINFKYAHNSTLENWRKGNSSLEWTIPNHYNLLKDPSVNTTSSRVLKFKSIEDYELSVPKIVHTLSSELLISNGGVFDYLSCLQKCFSEDYFMLQTIRASLQLKEFAHLK